MEKLKFWKYFHWYVCLHKDKLYWAWGGREGWQCVSDDQIRMPIWQVPDLLCAFWVSKRSFSLSCSTYIKADNNGYLLQYNILLHARKNYPTMIMTQAKTSLLHTEAFTFALYVSWHSLYWWNLKSYAILTILRWNFIYLVNTLCAHIHTLPADHQKFTVNNEHERLFSSPNTHTSLPYPPPQKSKNDVQSSKDCSDYIPTKHYQWKARRTNTKPGTPPTPLPISPPSILETI